MKERKKVILLILIFGLLVFIFCMSAKPVEQSAEMSYRIDRWICGIFIDEYEELPAQQQMAAALRLDFWVRKTAHCLEYFALGSLLFAAAGLLFQKTGTGGAAAFLTGTGYAVLDEIHQYFVPGRSCEFRDMLIDAAGVAAGVTVAAAIAYGNGKRRRRKKCQTHRKIKNQKNR